MRLKKISILVASFSTFMLMTVAQAAVLGPYVGGQLGWGNIHQPGITSSEMTQLVSTGVGSPVNLTTQATHTTGDSGLAGRAFAGYQLTPCWGIEAGWSRFHSVATDSTATAGAISATASGNITANAVDLMAKVTIPIPIGFSAIGKLGGAFLFETYRTNASIINGATTASASKSLNGHKVYPTFAFGVGYDITPRIVSDLTWTHIQKCGNSTLANTDLVALGLSYHFC